MIQVSPEEWQIIQSSLKKYPYKFYAFGSRAQHTARPFSDLDLFTQDDISGHIMTEIRGRFEDSNLPYKVDIVLDYYCSDEFRASIQSQLQLLALE